MGERTYLIRPDVLHDYAISLDNANVYFEGNYYFYDGSVIHPAAGRAVAVPRNEYMGNGRFNYSSMKRYMAVIFVGLALVAIMAVIDIVGEVTSITDLIFGTVPALHFVLKMIYYSILTACLIMLIFYFRSRKKMVEITFLKTRICIPQAGITYTDLMNIQNAIRGGY